MADQVFVDMLQLRRSEKNFMLRDLESEEFYKGAPGDFSTPSLQNQQQRLATLRKSIQQLKAMLPLEKKSICDDLSSAVDDYNDDFKRLVAAYRARGSENVGFEKDWRKNAHEIEKLLEETPNLPFSIELLELRRREKDYLMRGDQVFIDNVNSQLEKLRAIVPMAMSEKTGDVLRYLDNYESAFKGYQDQTAIVGLTEDKGLWRDLAEAVNSMEPLIVGSDTVTGIRQYADTQEASARRNLVWSQLVILVLGILGAVVLFNILGRLLTAPLVNMVHTTDAIARGDLTQPSLMEGRDETGRLASAFNKMVSSLKAILIETKALTNEIAAASNEIATGAQQQLASLNETATSLNEITTTAEEFKATMQEFADRSRAVQEAADDTARQSSDGRQLSKDSASRIGRVRSNAQTAGESVLSLSEQMQRIGEITASVNEVAEQTKLLALNASIEAARAGEDGRGFAVVATQVRELANQSKESANRIESLISETQKSMQDVVSRIEEGSRLSEDSVVSVKQMSSAFEQIADAIEQTNEAMSQINTGARQQELGIAELVSSITEIDAGSREAVAAAEQTQKSLMAITQRIQSLNETIARFKT
ncbi:methyl-accepting chemotaxis protein [Bremerella sp.]|uniref:methyl-accepting chemotaxis protein n=1 Tax=Bremerella sp. TaxID=2795602 RepID=UPI00391B6E9F